MGVDVDFIVHLLFAVFLVCSCDNGLARGAIEQRVLELRSMDLLDDTLIHHRSCS